ncbi:MAG: hypothetical protein WCF03_06375 [Nitrososphaeraceae archaeon]
MMVISADEGNVLGQTDPANTGYLPISFDSQLKERAYDLQD